MSQGFSPGTYPTTVTAANMTVEQGTPAVMDGTGQNLMRETIVAAGPIKWTVSRANEGDISALIGPGNPNDPDYFPPTTFFDNYAAIAGSPSFAKTTIAWRVNQQTGAALATVRNNGVDNGPDYTYNGAPVGIVHGIAYFNQTGASGWGYRMNDGVFANGGNGSTDLQMGIAGFDDGRGESNISTSMSYFPYEQGWKGAWVNSGASGPASFASSTPGLAANVNYDAAGVATVQLTGVNSANDGMLFVAPTHDGNRTNIAAAYPTGGGWSVAVREDDNAIFSGDSTSLIPTGENQFQFLYVPYTAPRLIGGQVNGTNGSLIHAANNAFFNLSRTGEGRYSLTVLGSDGVTKQSENDGTIILSVAGSNASGLADRKFMSYQYNTTTHTFDIQSREDVAFNSPNSENQFGDDLALRDVNFYFAWISFTNPLAPFLAGDYNNNGKVDAADYVVWRKASATATLPNDPTPGTVDQSDFDLWRANFGSSSAIAGGTGLTLGSVPEPHTIGLCLFGATWMAFGRRRQAVAG
jgi:hypothetical protein